MSGEGLDALLDVLVTTRDEDTLVAVIEAIGKLKDSDATSLVSEHLSSDSARVRKSAIEALGKIACPVSAHVLLETAADDEDDGVRRAAIRAVMRLRSREHLDEVVSIFESNQWKLTKGEAQLLGRYADWQAVPLLVDSITEYSWETGLGLREFRELFYAVWNRTAE